MQCAPETADALLDSFVDLSWRQRDPAHALLGQGATTRTPCLFSASTSRSLSSAETGVTADETGVTAEIIS